MAEYCEPSGATGSQQFVATVSTPATGYLSVRVGAEYCEPCTTITVTCPTATGTSGTAYSSSVSASGGISPYTYAVTSGALPTGLSLNSSTGNITGTPTTATTYSFTITATDASQCTGSSSGCQIVVSSSAAMQSIFRAFIMDCETIVNNVAFQYNSADWPGGTTFTYAGANDSAGTYTLRDTTAAADIATLTFSGAGYQSTGPLTLTDGHLYSGGIDNQSFLFANITGVNGPVILDFGDVEILGSHGSMISKTGIGINVSTDYPGMTSAKFRTRLKMHSLAGTIKLQDESANVIYSLTGSTGETLIDAAITLSGSHTYYLYLDNGAGTGKIQAFNPQVWIFQSGASRSRLEVPLAVGEDVSGSGIFYNNAGTTTYSYLNGPPVGGIFRKTSGVFATVDHWDILYVHDTGGGGIAGRIALFNRTTNLMVTGSEWIHAAGATTATLTIADNATNFDAGNDFEFRARCETGSNLVFYIFAALFPTVTT